MKIFPVRLGTLHSMVTSFGCLRTRCRPTSSLTWRAASKSIVRRIGTNTCRPVLPEVFTIGSSDMLDRKSTRLNSSHLVISYAVFCLKKKKLLKPTTTSVVVYHQEKAERDPIICSTTYHYNGRALTIFWPSPPLARATSTHLFCYLHPHVA